MELSTDWTKQMLENLIRDKIEETNQLEYKRAAALGPNNRERNEITKDVSAMANSAGGTIIYGIAEEDQVPIALDPVDRHSYSRETLEHVIQTIQPRIEGVRIQVIDLDSATGMVCYAVHVPQSHTAHQARDLRYYRRYNFNAVAMEDYEIRDVANRQKGPKIRATINLVSWSGDEPDRGTVIVRIENTGNVVIRNCMADVTLPLISRGSLRVEEDARLVKLSDGYGQRFRLWPGLASPPLFPKSDVHLRAPFKYGGFDWRHVDNRSMTSTKRMYVYIYADEMMPLYAELPHDAAWDQSVEIPSSEGHDLKAPPFD